MINCWYMIIFRVLSEVNGGGDCWNLKEVSGAFEGR